jgi:hypothetical protein
MSHARLMLLGGEPMDCPFLDEMLEAIDAIREEISGKTFDDFERERLTRLAVQRALEIISEAARRLPDEILARHPQLASATQLLRFSASKTAAKGSSSCCATCQTILSLILWYSCRRTLPMALTPTVLSKSDGASWVQPREDQ